MFRAFLNTDSLRRRQREPEEDKSSKKANTDDDAKTEDAKKRIVEKKYGPGGVITSSADEGREPDIFDTHVGPFIERYILWCQKKGVLLGWIPGVLGLVSFMTVAMVVGCGAGYFTGQGILWVLEKGGLVERLREAIAMLDTPR